MDWCLSRCVVSFERAASQQGPFFSSRISHARVPRTRCSINDRGLRYPMCMLRPRITSLVPWDPFPGLWPQLLRSFGTVYTYPVWSEARYLWRVRKFTILTSTTIEIMATIHASSEWVTWSHSEIHMLCYTTTMSYCVQLQPNYMKFKWEGGFRTNMHLKLRRRIMIKAV